MGPQEKKENMLIQILLADDHTLFREMLAEVLTRKAPGYTIIGEAVDGDEALELVARHRPDLLLLDYDMPGVGRLSDFCQAVAHHHPATRTLIVSGHAKEQIALEAAIGGAHGYVLKGAPITNLLDAITTVHTGGVWVDPHLPPQVFRAFLSQKNEKTARLGQLSRQELQVLALLAQQLTNKQIGTHLYISQKTVKNHLTHIFAKLGVTNRRQAALAFFAEQKGPRQKAEAKPEGSPPAKTGKLIPLPVKKTA
jgi:two-component system NarL family response regulator